VLYLTNEIITRNGRYYINVTESDAEADAV